MGRHNINEHSSRSHLVVSVTIVGEAPESKRRTRVRRLFDSEVFHSLTTIGGM